MQHPHPVDSSGSGFIPTVPLFVEQGTDFVPMIPKGYHKVPKFAPMIPNVDPKLPSFAPTIPKAYPGAPKFVPLVPAKEEPNDEDPNDKAPKSFPAPMALKLVRKKPLDVTQNDGYLEGTRSPRKMTAVKSPSKAARSDGSTESASARSTESIAMDPPAKKTKAALWTPCKASQAQPTTTQSARSDGSTESARSDRSTESARSTESIAIMDPMAKKTKTVGDFQEIPDGDHVKTFNEPLKPV